MHLGASLNAFTWSPRGGMKEFSTWVEQVAMNLLQAQEQVYVNELSLKVTLCWHNMSENVKVATTIECNDICYCEEKTDRIITTKLDSLHAGTVIAKLEKGHFYITWLSSGWAVTVTLYMTSFQLETTLNWLVKNRRYFEQNYHDNNTHWK